MTNISGYVGGSILDHLFRAHPDYDYAVLVRDEKRGEPVKKKYASVRLAIGNLDDAAVLEKEAAQADVVIRTSLNVPKPEDQNAGQPWLASGN